MIRSAWDQCLSIMLCVFASFHWLNFRIWYFVHMSLPSPLPPPCATLDSAKLLNSKVLQCLHWHSPPFVYCIVGPWNAITILYCIWDSRHQHATQCTGSKQLQLAVCSDRNLRLYFNCDWFYIVKKIFHASKWLLACIWLWLVTRNQNPVVSIASGSECGWNYVVIRLKLFNQGN